MAIEFKKFNPSILRNATLIRDGHGYMKTYNLNNGYIYKEIKEKDYSSFTQALFHDEFISCLSKKLSLVPNLPDDYIVLPNKVYTSNDKVVGYTIPFIDMEDFDNVVNRSSDLNFLIDSFLLLSQAVRECNKAGIILPDLGNASNIFYNPKTKKIKFIDFDGLQIGDLDSFNVSCLMDFHSNPVFQQKKYYDKASCLFTSNFDKASILALFLHYTTMTNLTNFLGIYYDTSRGIYSVRKEAIDEYLKDIGLLDSSLDDDVRLVYDNNKNNNYLDTAIKRLSRDYKWNKDSLTFKKR